MAEWEDGAWMESEEALELEVEEGDSDNDNDKGGFEKMMADGDEVTLGSSGWNSKATSFDGSRPGTSDSAGRELSKLDRYSKGLFDEKGKMMGGWSPWRRDTPPLMSKDEAQGAGYSRSRCGVNERRGGGEGQGQGQGQGRGAQGMSRRMENRVVVRQGLRTAQVVFTLKDRQRPKSVAGVVEARMMGDAASGGGGGRGAEVRAGADVGRQMQAARALARYAEEARARAQARRRGPTDAKGGSSMMGGRSLGESGEGRAGVEGPLDSGGDDMCERGGLQGPEDAAGWGKGGWEQGTAGHGSRAGARQADNSMEVPTRSNRRGARPGAPQEHRDRGADSDAGFPRVGVRSSGGTSEGGNGGLHHGRHVWNQGQGMLFYNGVQGSAGRELASVHSSRVLHIELGPRPESVKKLRKRLNLCHRHVVHAPKTPGVDGSVDGSVQMASIQPMARGQTHNATKAVADADADADAEVGAVAGRNHAIAAAAKSERANDGGRNYSSAAAAKSERANDGGGGIGGRSKVEVTGVGAMGAGGELTPFSHSRLRQSRGGSGRGWHMNGRVIKRSEGLDEFAHLGQDSPIAGPWAPDLGNSFLSASLV
jgi:hypothetical protein